MSDSRHNLTHRAASRSLPHSVGKRLLLHVFVAVFALLTVMEIKARRDEYETNYPVSSDLWVAQWLELDDLPSDQLVVIGASRMQYGIVPDQWKSITGVKPYFLAWPGAPPLPVLKMLANRQSFNGTVLCGFAPSFSFSHRDGPFQQAIYNNISMIEPSRYSLSFHASLAGSDFLLPRFKCLNATAYSPIMQAYTNWPFSNRDGLLIPLIFPFDEVFTRQLEFKFHPDIENTLHVELISQIQDSTLRQFAHAGPFDISEATVQYKAAVDAIRSRGGNVIFLRAPSEGKFLSFETEHYPREQYYDRIVNETECFGIHFEDDPQLRDLPCVEDSHLNRENAGKYTRRVIEILRGKKLID